MYVYEFTLTDVCSDNIDLFLQVLKLQYPNFASYSDGKFYFISEVNRTNIQLFINKLTLDQMIDIIYRKSDNSSNIIVKSENPTPKINPTSPVIWLNSKTGEIFTCIDTTPDDNVWRGTFGTLIRNIPDANKFDFFGDGSRVAMYLLNGNANDVGGKYNGYPYQIKWVRGKDGLCAQSNNRSTITIRNLPFTKDTDVVTVSAWIKWNKRSSSMPFGWYSYDIYCIKKFIGFNTFVGDCFGTEYSYKDFIYIIVEFRKGQYGTININGEEKELRKIFNRDLNPSRAYMGSTFHIFGAGSSSGYRNFGLIDRVSIFNRSLTLMEKQELFIAETKVNSIYIKPVPILLEV